ncbi:MAG: hypothetical protein FWF28_00255 [Micrococcales bacterium]|nr:hypothetical protein [Micrococcales bacterium]
MSDESPVTPYGSARDLPSVQDIAQQIAGLRMLGILLPKDQRNQLRQLDGEYRHITGLVDAFYALLGRRNWVFTGDLNLPAIEQVIDTDDEEVAETRLLNYYKEANRITFPLRSLHRFEAMRPRISLLEKAFVDHKAGRYYSTVLVLLSVMDGFVNDLDTASRQGLHARPPEDMVAWDSVAGHHLGLSHAHESFLRNFYKTDTTEVTELFRNGIMHGTLVSFDNEIIATKAWNRLFAVADWAEARERRAKPTEPASSLRESVHQWKAARDRTTKIEQWQPHEYEPDLAAEEIPEVAQVCASFLEEWRKGQWGLVGAHFLELGNTRSSVGELAVLAKDLYGAVDLSKWAIMRIRHIAAAVANADVELVVNGDVYRTDLRWVRVGDTGETTTEWEPGRWALAPYGPSLFLKPEALVQGSGSLDAADDTG